MASIPLSSSALDELKKAVRYIYSDCKSSHLTESLASALGFNTHAALLVALSKSQVPLLYTLLNDEAFRSRMREFGYPHDPLFSFEDVKTSAIIRTECSHADRFTYKSSRTKAWRNLIVSAVNEALKRGFITLKPNGNLWPGFSNDVRNTYLFEFSLANGLPAKASLFDAGFGEVSVHVAVNPIGDWVRASNAGFTAGDAFATSWLERENGAWIQTNTTSLSCRHHLVKALASIQVEPLGYGDRGRVIM